MPSITTLPQLTPAMTCDGVVPLPPGKPGRIYLANEEDNDISGNNEGSGHENGIPWLKKDREKGAHIWDESEMRNIALDEARQVLPREIQTMLSPETFMEVAEMCELGPETSDEEIAEKLAECLVDLVWTPLCGCVPTLRGISSSDVRFKLQLFWRCTVALCAMPTRQLAALSERKRKFLQDIDAHLPERGARLVEVRLAHIRLNLPLFSMTAKFPSEIEKPSRAPAVPENTVKADETPVQEPIKREIQAAEDKHRAEVWDAQQTANQESEADPQADNKAFTAAKHTYDVGYNKWEKFDVDAAMRDVDKPNQPKTEAVKIPRHDEMGARCAHADPMKALDEAIERMNDKVASQPNNAAESAAENTGRDTSTGPCDSTDLPAAEPCQTQDVAVSPEVHAGSEPVEVQEAIELCPGDRVEIFGLESEQGRSLNGSTGLVEGHDEKSGRVKVQVASTAASSKIMLLKAERLQRISTSNVEAKDGDAATGSTAAALNKDYKKWDHFEEEDEIDEVDSDDGFTDQTMHDLDALTGPKEEIAKIHAHWQRQGKQQKRSAHKHHERTQGTVGKRDPAPAAQPPEETGPVVPRPCVYRPPDAPEAAPSKALNKEYKKWKEFDADEALLEFENEGTTKEGTAMRCSAGGGSACINTEGYTKDREEYELDEDIAKQMGGLKKIIAQRLQDAGGLKAEGNSYMRQKRLKDAVIAYKSGLTKMEICQQASVIMADSMSSKQTRLVGDLHRNLAAAQLELGDFEGARESCDRALECTSKNGEEPDEEKARYRRATALLQLGRATEAQPDIKRLAACRGADDPVVKRLVAQAADQTN